MGDFLPLSPCRCGTHPIALFLDVLEVLHYPIEFRLLFFRFLCVQRNLLAEFARIRGYRRRSRRSRSRRGTHRRHGPHRRRDARRGRGRGHGLSTLLH